MAGNPLVGPALPAIVNRVRLAGGTGTVGIVDDRENLKGRLGKTRHQASIRRYPDRSFIGKREEIVMFERCGQRPPVRGLATHQECPETLRLRRSG